MCFSATGSFAIAGVLTGLGAASTSRNASAPHRMLAAMPFIFAAQQAAEGTVWLTVATPDAPLNRLAVNSFLGVALVLWPMWAPYSLRMVELDPVRRRMLSALFAVGCMVAVGAALLLTLWYPVAVVAGHSIRYDYIGAGDLPRHIGLLGVYVIPTVVPFWVSTMRLMRTMGVTLAVSLVVTLLLQRDTLTSVWCFFAAIVSVLVLVAVQQDQRPLTAAGAAVNR